MAAAAQCKEGRNFGEAGSSIGGGAGLEACHDAGERGGGPRPHLGVNPLPQREGRGVVAELPDPESEAAR